MNEKNTFFIILVTGLQAGANISGDLKDPASSIPKGTLLALLISAISYAVFVIFAGGSAMRDASGDIADLVNGTLIGVIPACAATKVFTVYVKYFYPSFLSFLRVSDLGGYCIQKLFEIFWNSRSIFLLIIMNFE